jgi:hypothetical protein
VLELLQGNAAHTFVKSNVEISGGKGGSFHVMKRNARVACDVNGVCVCAANGRKVRVTPVA